jgi:radical SAM protein with 4Fe4S-binding SPASM domain
VTFYCKVTAVTSQSPIVDACGRYTLTVELTSFCNQRCSHCYNAFEHSAVQSLPSNKLLEVLGRILTEVEFASVDFSGGEPLSYSGLLSALELCRKCGVRPNIVTNATLVTDTLARQLAEVSDLTVQVTFNAPRAELHDAAVGLSGAWRQAHRGIELLQHHGVRVAGAAVITHDNATLVGQILDHFKELAIDTVALMRLMPSGLSAGHFELLPTRSDLIEALGQASDRRFQQMALRVGGPLPPCIIDQKEYPTIRFGWCSIGLPVQDFVLSADGRLRICPFFEQSLGDACTESIATMVRSPMVTNYRKRAPEFCVGCVALPKCLGGCGAAALAASGDIGALDPIVAQHVDAQFAQRMSDTKHHLPTLDAAT